MFNPEDHNMLKKERIPKMLTQLIWGHVISLILFKTQGLNVIINYNLVLYIWIKFSVDVALEWSSQELKNDPLTPLLLLLCCTLSCGLMGGMWISTRHAVYSSLSLSGKTTIETLWSCLCSRDFLRHFHLHKWKASYFLFPEFCSKEYKLRLRWVTYHNQNNL